MARKKKQATDSLVSQQVEDSTPQQTEVVVPSIDMTAKIKENKQFTKMLVTSGDDPRLKVEKLSFGIPTLDAKLHGGLPVGKMTLIYGDSHVGKTYIVQKLIEASQKKAKSIVFIDADKGFEPEWWKTTGVDIEHLTVAQPDYGEQAFNLVHHLMEIGIDLVIVDSLDLLVPTVEAEGMMEDSTIGLQARMNALGFRKAKRLNYKTVFICTNHIREGMGRFSQFRIPGGKAQEDFSSVMLWIAKGGKITEKDIMKGGDDKKKVGFNMRISIEKDKVSGALGESCTLPFIFAGGMIDTVSGLIELAIESKLIKGTPPYYVYKDTKFFGKLALKSYLNEHPEEQKELQVAVFKQ